MTAFFVVQTALQATSRVIYAFSRDHGKSSAQLAILTSDSTSSIGLPDRGFFGVNSRLTDTPLRSVWLATVVCILLGLLDLASPIAANAIFSLTPMALDGSYIIPIFLRRIYHNHPEVNFKPGPFSLGDGFIGNFCNWLCILWTCFITVIFSLPTVFPVTKDNMNYASVCSIISRLQKMTLTRLLRHDEGYYRRSGTSINVSSQCVEHCLTLWQNYE